MTERSFFSSANINQAPGATQLNSVTPRTTISRFFNNCKHRSPSEYFSVRRIEEEEELEMKMEGYCDTCVRGRLATCIEDERKNMENGVCSIDLAIRNCKKEVDLLCRGRNTPCPGMPQVAMKLANWYEEKDEKGLKKDMLQDIKMCFGYTEGGDDLQDQWAASSVDELGQRKSIYSNLFRKDFQVNRR